MKDLHKWINDGAVKVFQRIEENFSSSRDLPREITAPQMLTQKREIRMSHLFHRF